MWLKMLLVFAGGGLGAMTRELSMSALGRYSEVFPFDIFLVNVLASFVLGLVFGLHRNRHASDNMVLLISTGFCGGLSTFSTFMFGAYSEMVIPGWLALSLLYMIASVVVGFCLAGLGCGVATRLRRT